MEVTLAQLAPKVELTAKQRAIIERLAGSRTEAQRLVERAQIILRSADGELCVEQAAELAIDANEFVGGASDSREAPRFWRVPRPRMTSGTSRRRFVKFCRTNIEAVRRRSSRQNK